jgi:prepilin signal peptidase PulO-like enzyme (type II secretory pathway)
MPYLFLIPVWLCWGSFLNVVAYRVLREQSLIKPRSHCPHCNHFLAWYDLIPVFSWIFLKGKCRYCGQPISKLYPFIELLTALVMTLLVALVPTYYMPAYLIFFSALIVTIRSDFETMLISQYMTLFIIPVGIACSCTNLLPISIWQSLSGALFGYLFLWSIAQIFLLATRKKGMGDGDFELLALIGSFLGISGAWYSLMIGSIIGSFAGLFMIYRIKATSNTKIPFGPFLAIAAIALTLYQFILP